MHMMSRDCSVLLLGRRYKTIKSMAALYAEIIRVE